MLHHNLYFRQGGYVFIGVCLTAAISKTPTI